MHTAARRLPRRLLSTSAPRALAQKQRPAAPPARKPRLDAQDDDAWLDRELDGRIPAALKGKAPAHAKRNALGVQLLSRSLHAQLFAHSAAPPPPDSYVAIARAHLRTHGLDPAQGALLPDVDFTLPPLQGPDLAAHFDAIGERAAHPWAGLADGLARAELPPMPEHWDAAPGWTKYTHAPGGGSFHEHVEYPDEDALVFDVETLPHIAPYAVMATAASRTAWYAWVSPWLLGHTDDVVQLPSLGPRTAARLVVGHNVSYDRLRLADEYHAAGTGTRFLDTMALHVALAGISAHQRPALAAHRARKARLVEGVEGLLCALDERAAAETDPAKRAALERERDELAADTSVEDDDGAGPPDGRWEDLTALNSLADVAALHCGVELDKSTRDDFLVSTREEIRAGLQDYLAYCAADVHVTHQVYGAVYPPFRAACPSPVSLAGVLAMGSAFLPVNQEWDKYVARAEAAYRARSDAVRARLLALAEEARALADGERWRGDPWLEQMDWTPKKVGKSRGLVVPDAPAPDAAPAPPKWHADIARDPFSPASLRALPLLLRTTAAGRPLRYSSADRWHTTDADGAPTPVAPATLLNSARAKMLRAGALASEDDALLLALCEGVRDETIAARIRSLADARLAEEDTRDDEWHAQLDWAPAAAPKAKKSAEPAVHWPKWYWELARPKKGAPPGALDLTVRSALAPLLLRLAWRGWPLVRSREHGWAFRVPLADAGAAAGRAKRLAFDAPEDAALAAQEEQYAFFKLPHKDGDAANVGSPLGRSFLPYAADGTLTSPGDAARGALDLSAQCAYWISARDRIAGQTVVWHGGGRDLGLPAPSADGAEKWGVILPQVIAMGTVTRRAIERTWLTASNAKANRVGSELKAMVRAPPGTALVGADVDAEELWIAALLGDAQFGLHGASAVGWMTLEGTKAAGTDLHSKTGAILGISRDQAKVFNYSRIYGAGQRHAVQLLLQGNAAMAPDDAASRAAELYTRTKGSNTRRGDVFRRRFWHGGSESFLFNALERIACAPHPRTPALGAGVTSALTAGHLTPGFGTDFMTSRINWAVQSSGVDYLHCLIVAMEHLCGAYDIGARYLLSVHDEVRYLVKEEDQHRAALALQVANLWTRALFAQRLGFDDLPAGVAFFSAVDVDSVLRKEPGMSCVTPSQPTPLPPGASLDIAAVLAATRGTLRKDGGPMLRVPVPPRAPGAAPAEDGAEYRAESAFWLQAQASTDANEVRDLWFRASGQRVPVRAPRNAASMPARKPKPNPTKAKAAALDLDEEAERYVL